MVGEVNYTRLADAMRYLLAKRMIFECRKAPTFAKPMHFHPVTRTPERWRQLAQISAEYTLGVPETGRVLT